VARRVAAARVTWTWAALWALTGLSWALAATGRFSPGTALTIAVLAIAAVKTRLVIRQFMEVRTAPRWLRRATDGWLTVFMAAIIGLYLLH
jgi:ABC-type nickel/cobalt efflux system permease component RcnA